ncbi:MAG: lipoprotein, partial [Gammaproteobacteria bacterium]|nr:lipoprotein [Gammaproteobacteria bacterium]
MSGITARARPALAALRFTGYNPPQLVRQAPGNQTLNTIVQVVTLALLLSALSACGQKGPLQR